MMVYCIANLKLYLFLFNFLPNWLSGFKYPSFDTVHNPTSQHKATPYDCTAGCEGNRAPFFDAIPTLTLPSNTNGLS